jgi:hypothetical protein
MMASAGDIVRRWSPRSDYYRADAGGDDEEFLAQHFGVHVATHPCQRGDASQQRMIVDRRG